MRWRSAPGGRQTGRARPRRAGAWTRWRDPRAGERARNNPPSPIPSLKWNPLLRWLPGRWKSKRPLLTSVLVPLLTVFFFAMTVLAFVAIYELFWGDGKLLVLDEKCATATQSCGLVTSLTLTLYPISAAVFWVFIWRLDAVRTRYRKEAFRHPDRLLETQIPSRKIVGRDDLCEVLQTDLARSSADESGALSQRPVILVGGVGIGKTAVLARLTQMLAQRGAVPVPIRLRTDQRSEKLDLHELARRKFLDTAPVLSDAEADKIWRRLKANRQIVIVADGLEEALMSVTDTRETALRVAIRDVRRHGVALIISSRPHEALAYLDAALVTLEPLEPRAAYEYITEAAESDDQRTRAEGIVRRAAVADMPLFMHYARELVDAKALDASLDVRDVGRLGLRVRLLDRWMEVLQAGRVQRSVPVTPERRRNVIAKLQAFAVVGLIRDSLQVTFDDIKELAGNGADGPAAASNGSDPEGASTNGAKPPDRLKRALGATTEGLREIAADADRLGLADAQPDGLRFRHSVMQAYLGSRAITQVLGDGGADETAQRIVAELLDDGLTKPGRELLMALAMSCTVGSDTARTRAIGLLLRNVEVEGAKAVHTASAVIAAASASTEQTLARIAPTPPGTAYTEAGEFREHVVLWLMRGEREDAEREARRAFAAVDRAQRRAAAADSEEYRKSLALQGAEEAEHRVAEVGGVTDSANEARRRQATLARKQAEADLAAARAVSDAARSDVARAWAEVGVAKTILAERLLAEAAAEPDPDAKARARKEADASLSAAHAAADQAAEMRRTAAEHQDPVSMRNLDAGALVEFFVERVALAQAELAEAQAEPKRAEGDVSDAPEADEEVGDAEEAETGALPDHDFEAAASERLDEVIEMARCSPLIRRTGGLGTTQPDGDWGAKEARALARAVHGFANAAEKIVNDAEAESDVVEARMLLIEARRQLGAETDEDPFDPRLWDAATARARITTLRLAALALSSAAAARERLDEMHAENVSAATADQLRKRAIASLGKVSKSLEVRAEASPMLKVEPREAATDALALAALAEVKAEGAERRLGSHAATGEGRAPEPVYAGAAAVVHEVVEQADKSRFAQRDGVSPAVETHRATSRKQVLEPLRRTTREHDTQADEGVQASKLDAIGRLADAAQFSWLWEVCKAEPDYLIRLAAVRSLGDGGRTAFNVVERHLLAIEEAAVPDAVGPRLRAEADRRLRREDGLETLGADRAFELMGLLLPLLYASIERDAKHNADGEREGAVTSGDGGSANGPSTAHGDLLQRWVQRVGAGMFITSEMALAQGFRLVANQRTLDAGQRGMLTARVRELLQKTDFWFARIALVQALTLGLIADTAGKPGAKRDRASDDDAELKIYGCWSSEGHPLVARTIELCATAFRRRQPENYIWLDEGLAIARLGAGPTAVHAAGTRDEWIPGSAGWLSLASPAQQLLGDVVVFLNLADRCDRREDLLGHTKPSADEPDKEIWPPCMHRPEVRHRLNVRRSVDERPEPGANCAPECDVNLCPYPGLGEELARGELSEAFCRRQQEIVPSRELKRFWREMEERPRA